MTFQVVRAAAFEQDLDDFAAYTTAYSGEFSREQFTRLNHVLTVELASAPAMWGLFFITGAPYHAYLFRVGRRTSYWIVYSIDEAAKRVDLLRFWIANREPQAFEL